jgi:diguanylate cyclase (GGDEF)-like protein
MSIPEFQSLAAGEFVVYGDLNCPFCFALHERLFAWNLLDRIEWRLIVHAPDLEASSFSMEDQSLLANEVFSIHHRAPDVPVNLPKIRPGSETATRLLQGLDDLPVAQQVTVRLALYRALWVDGRDIADLDTLEDVIAAVGVADASQFTETPTEKFDVWQKEWESRDDFDRRIPIMERASNDSLLLGLPTEEALVDFLKGERTFFVNDAVCVFQPRPITLVFGSLENLWPLVESIRDSCEVLHFADADRCRGMLSEHESVDFLLIEHEFACGEDYDLLSEMAGARGVTRVVASATGSDAAEMRALQSGAAEYLPVDRSASVLSARFDKLVIERRKSVSMEQHAKFDALTQVPNRREFQARTEQEWRRLIDEGGGHCALLLIDIDFFKAYNDTYGHLAGDTCLKQVASVLRSSAREYEDFIARYGGEEFVLLLPGVTQDAAKQIGERLRQAVLAEKIEHKGSSIQSGHVTVSIGGVSAFANVHETPGDLIRLADDCLYQAKAAGRNTVITQ